MVRMSRYLAVVVLFLGVASLAIGVVFVEQGVAAKRMIVEGLDAEKVTLGIDENAASHGDVVDTAEEAQVAQNTLEEHLRDRYGTYGDTERGSPERATYLDGTTLRNSLNLAVMGFGVSTVVTITGIFMIITGIALGGTGLGIHRLNGRAS